MSAHHGLTRFTLNGEQHELTRETVETRLCDVRPVPLQKHAVRVHQTWFPAVQAFEIATGIPRSQFDARIAKRNRSELGYEVVGG